MNGPGGLHEPFPYDRSMISPLRLTRSLAVVTALCALSLTGCGEDDDNNNATTTNCTYETGNVAAKDAEAPSESPAYEGEVEVTITTTVGDIDVVLDADGAPCTVNSFLSLAEQGYYDETNCHRIEPGFVIQCGDPSGTGSGGPGYQYADELTGDEEYPEGTLAMANAGPDTNGSQFFLVTGDASHLSTHTVFGKVTDESLAVIRDVDRAHSSGDEVPVDITKVTISS